MKFKATILFLIAVSSWRILAADEDPDPKLLNTANSSAEFRNLWGAKYPQLFIGEFYFPVIDVFLTGYAMRDREIQSGRSTGRVLAGNIIRINRDLDEFQTKHPNLQIPEFAMIKRRISFEAYSDGALKFFLQMIREIKRGTPYPSFEDTYRSLMLDDYFGKKEELRRANLELDEWLLQKNLVRQLFEQKTFLLLDLDELPKTLFREQQRKAIGSRIQEMRSSIAAGNLDKSGSEEITKLVREIEELATRFQKMSTGVEPSTAEKRTGQAPSQPVQLETRSSDPARGNEAATTENGHDYAFVFIAGICVLITLISMVMHAKGQLVFFGDYTDAAMTFVGPIVSFLSAFILPVFGVDSSMATAR